MIKRSEIDFFKKICLRYKKNIACLSSCLRGGPQPIPTPGRHCCNLNRVGQFYVLSRNAGGRSNNDRLGSGSQNSDRQQRRCGTPATSECMQMGDRPRQQHILKGGTPDHAGFGGDKLQFYRYVEPHMKFIWQFIHKVGASILPDYFISHTNDLTWVPWILKSPATRLDIQQFAQD